MDDWQDHALSTRHMHNRNSRRPSGKGKKGGQFDVRKAFGEYEVKCASWERALGELEDEERNNDEEAAFELLRLTEDGQGVLGELVLPGVLRAAVVLAATRRGLDLLTRSLAGEDEDSEHESDSKTREEGEANDGDEHDEENDDEEEDPPTRFESFEKNSFRSPKFWLAWNGALTTPRPDSPPPSPALNRKYEDEPPASPTLHRTGSSFPPPKPTPSTQQVAAEGMGYVVFTGADCRKFKGTISCRELGWKDVAFSGFKSVSRSESDRQLLWGGRDVETGWRAEDAEDGERGARLDSRRRVVFD